MTPTRPIVETVPPTKQNARVLGVPQKEANLHSAVAGIATDLLRGDVLPGRRVLVLPELEFAYGRPDLVVAAVDVREWQRWRAKGVRACTAPALLAVALDLQQMGGRASIADLRQRIRPSRRDRLADSLAALENHGLVDRRGGRAVLRVTLGRAIGAAAGVEVKLNNWRRAVRQAQSWEGKVDATWLAFPSRYLPNVPRSPGLRRFGLISVDDAGAAIVRRARSPRASVERHVLLEQHIYRRWSEYKLGPTA